MGNHIKHDWAIKSLQHAGYIGSFQVAYRDNRIKGNGRSGPFYWLLKKQMAEGVSLRDIDRAYHSADLDHIREMRANFIGHGGRYENRFRVKHPFSDGYAHVHAAFTVIVDLFGIPVSAEGALFDVTDLMGRHTR